MKPLVRFGSLHDLPLKAASVALPNNAARKRVLYNCVFIPDIPLPATAAGGNEDTLY